MQANPTPGSHEKCDCIFRGEPRPSPIGGGDRTVGYWVAASIDIQLPGAVAEGEQAQGARFVFI